MRAEHATDQEIRAAAQDDALTDDEVQKRLAAQARLDGGACGGRVWVSVTDAVDLLAVCQRQPSEELF